MSSSPTFEYRWNAFQLQGRRRRQEDDLRVERLDRHSTWFFAVADGLGGHADGDWASHTAIRATRDFLKQGLRKAELSNPPDGEAWRAAIIAAHEQVVELDEYAGFFSHAPASTLVAAVADKYGRVSLTSIGDSSVWHLCAQDTTLLFNRQGSGNWVQFALGAGVMAGQATQTESLQLSHPDRLVFATDGLETLPPEQLEALFRLPLDEAVAQLILAIRAADHPHQDNVTVLIVDAIQTDVDEDEP